MFFIEIMRMSYFVKNNENIVEFFKNKSKKINKSWNAENHVPSPKKSLWKILFFKMFFLWDICSCSTIWMEQNGPQNSANYILVVCLAAHFSALVSVLFLKWQQSFVETTQTQRRTHFFPICHSLLLFFFQWWWSCTSFSRIQIQAQCS